MHIQALDQARTEFERGETFKARETLAAALSESDASARTALQLALAAVLLQDGDLADGLRHLEHLRATTAWSPVVEAYTAGALLGLGQVSAAKDILDAACERAPEDFYVLLKRGELYCRLGVYETAIDALQRAVAVHVEDRHGREAAHRLLRFARRKASGGFVRQLRARRTGFGGAWLRWPWTPAARGATGVAKLRLGPLAWRQ